MCPQNVPILTILGHLQKGRVQLSSAQDPSRSLRISRISVPKKLRRMTPIAPIALSVDPKTPILVTVSEIEADLMNKSIRKS